ncbi:uncharacterized protein [Diadema antillarum]|uniref:uncharacterized protein n=1 Tax=Diadema antillarum TaxID=105358 RepID=UPI003A85E5D7
MDILSGSEKDHVRVLMCCTPRSTSTVFAKCLSFVPESQIFFEPYGYCYTFLDKLRSAGISVDLDSTAPYKHISQETWQDLMEQRPGETNIVDYNMFKYPNIKRLLDNPDPNKKVIFVKDMAYGMSYSTQFLPDRSSNYRFAFLIRHPIRVFSSWRRAVLNIHDILPKVLTSSKTSDASKGGDASSSEAFHVGNDTASWYSPPGLFYKELYDLWTFVMEKYDPNPVIVDSDDLVSDPSTVLPKFCQKLGIPYSDALLEWDGNPNTTDDWVCGFVKPSEFDFMKVYCDTAFNSTCFKGSSSMPSFESLTPDVKDCVKRAMPYYLEMSARKI